MPQPGAPVWRQILITSCQSGGIVIFVVELPSETTVGTSADPFVRRRQTRARGDEHHRMGGRHW
jgi:hypothetical protein